MSNHKALLSSHEVDLPRVTCNNVRSLFKRGHAMLTPATARGMRTVVAGDLVAIAAPSRLEALFSRLHSDVSDHSELIFVSANVARN